MAFTRAARKAWSKASSHWSWSRLPAPSDHSPSPSPPPPPLPLRSFSFDIRPVWSRFPSPLNPNTSSFTLSSTSSQSGLYFPFNKWIAYSGPLFLCSPTWQLSQSATPLYPPGKFVFRGSEWEGDKQQKKESRINLFVRKHLAENARVRWQVADAQLFDGASLLNAGALEWENSASNAIASVNWPNAISIARMLSGPLLGWMILNDLYYPAFVALVFAGASDWLDGYVARKMKINSVLGSYLDPLADKVLIMCVAMAMIKNNLLPPALVALVVVRDFSLVAGAFYKRAHSLGWKWKSWGDFFNVDNSGVERIEPLFLSKVNTVLQLALVGTALLQPEIGTEDSFYLLTWLSWLVAATTLASWAGYGLLLFQKGPQPAIRNSRMISGNKAKDSQ
ncbi:hypothetical protein KI387_026941 [Taxus chinensis]|uniref:Cardiolipin synthase n=1 Tax=Taxus chinensis TaxID=29808 RepID=A0AA38FX72_TAXCH|nr:hypothetical protein KI387_026941 [Taxus chinensis]